MSAATVNSFLNTLGLNHCRGLLVLSGEQLWVVKAAAEITASLGDIVWMGEGAPANTKAVGIGHGKQYLGQEINHLVVNAYSGLHPNSLGAVSGAIKAGGLLVLLTPPLKDWAAMPDLDYQRLSVANYASQGQRFIARIARLLPQLPEVAYWQQGQALVLPTVRSTTIVPVIPPFKSEHQQQAYEAILKVATGHRRRPLLITAKRGRGKSASLGLAANALVAQHGKKIVLCAPSKAAVTEVLKFIEIRHQDSVQFYTVEAMQRLRPQADIVLVDEAAGIPVPVLAEWLQRYSRIVFASTHYGYEGYGQGFTLRFQQSLKSLAPQHKHLQLQHAIRWQTPDPLEQCLDELLLLHAELAPVANAAEPLSYSLVAPSNLAVNETLLGQCYALLVGAHYQTTPDDLRVLLDGPNISLLVAQQSEHVVGVLMLAQEGGLDERLHADICAAKRRLKGHLAPQLLAANTGETALLKQQCWRVVRIAVHPQLRRQGVAKALLAQAQQQAQINGIDALCAVFGFTAELMPFWSRCGFVPLTISSRKDNASGAYSGLVYKGLSKQAQGVQPSMAAHFPPQLMVGLSDYLNQIDANAAVAILRGCVLSQQFTAAQLSQLHDFAVANKSLESCLNLLLPLAMSAPSLLAAQPQNNAHNEACFLLVVRVLLKWPLSKIVERTAVTGKDQLITQLRAVVAQLLPLLLPATHTL